MEEKIDGGATLWARKTIDSEIFFDKPDKWFKIWFFIVNEVSHQDNGRYKRGERYFRYEWIMERTKATKAQVHHCLRFLRKNSMIATHKKTHGLFIEVLKYNTYQRLDTYKRHTERQTEDKQKTNRRHNINKNVKNVKNGINKYNVELYQGILDYLNQKTNRGYKPTTKSYQRLINARLNEKFTVNDFKKVIDIKTSEWLGTNMENYLRPETLFGTKFESYLNQKGGSNGNRKHLQQQPKTESEYDHLCKVYRNDT